MRCTRSMKTVRVVAFPASSVILAVTSRIFEAPALTATTGKPFVWHPHNLDLSFSASLPCGLACTNLLSWASSSPLHRHVHRASTPDRPPLARWSAFGSQPAWPRIPFRPCGFAPLRRLPPLGGLRACCIPLPTLGFAAFPSSLPVCRSSLGSGTFPRDAVLTPRRIPLAISRTASPRPLPALPFCSSVIGCLSRGKLTKDRLRRAFSGVDHPKMAGLNRAAFEIPLRELKRRESADFAALLRWRVRCIPCHC